MAVGLEKAINLLLPLAKQGNGQAMQKISLFYLFSENPEESKKWEQLADKKFKEDKAKFNKWMELAEKYRSAAKKFCEKDKSPSKCISGSSCYAAAVIHEYSNDVRVKKFKKTLEGGLLSKGSMEKAMEEFQPMINDKVYAGPLSKIAFECYAKTGGLNK